ncbi:hypothetical protein [Stenotrophomonas rhizophila]
MKAALIVLFLVVTLPLAYFAIEFVQAKKVCEEMVVATQTKIYQGPGADAERDAAYKAALSSAECTRVATFATFVQRSVRGQ